MSESYNVERKSLESLLEENKTYEIPSYQRDYSWKKDNAEQLWTDLREVLESTKHESNLLGAMVVLTTDIHSSKFKVVDGQQRLATISLILCAIKTYLFSLKIKTQHKMIDFMIENLDDLLKYEKKPRVRLSHTDAEIFECIIQNEDPNYEKIYNELCKHYEDGKGRNHDSHMRLLDNYKMLCEKIKEWSKKFNLEKIIDNHDSDGVHDGVRNMMEYVTKITKHNHFAFISVHDEYIAYKIFNTFNSTGEKLTQADLIKSHLLNIIQNNKGVSDSVKKQWTAIFDEMVENPDQLLYESLLSRNPTGSKDGVTINMNNLYKVIKKTYKNSEDVEKYVKELGVDAKLIKHMDYPKELPTGNAYGEIERKFEHMHLINATYIRVSILAAYRKWCTDDKFLELLDCLVTFFFKFKVINGGTAENVRSIARKVTKQIHEDKDIGTIIHSILIDEDVRGKPEPRVDNELFKTQFPNRTYKLSRGMAKYILLSFEAYLRKKDNKETHYPHKYELEHILPRSRNDNWKESKFLNAKNDRNDIASYKNRLGNLTLLSEKWNRGLGAKGFTEKRDSKKGYANSDFEINKQYLKDYSEWTAKTVIDRHERLNKLACDVWSFERYEKYL